MMNITEFRDALGMPAAQIKRAERLLSSITTKFESLTMRFWQARTGATISWTPDLTDTYLWFYGIPVVTLTSLVEWWEADGPALNNPINIADYVFDMNNGLITKTRNYRFRQHVDAVYDCGLQPSQIPADVKEALILQAQFELTRFSAGKLDIDSQVVGKSSSKLMTAVYHPTFKECARQNKRSVYGNHG